MLDNILDRFGITATTLCALHCILLPIILPALPVLGLGFLADHLWERMYLLSTAVMGFIALYIGFQRYHKKLYPFYLLFIGAFIYWHKHDLPEEYQFFAIAAGATLIVIAHIINIKLCNSCKRCEQEHACD